MTGLKAAVVGMGAVILIGFVVVVVTIVGRLAGDDASPTFGEVAVELPEGCRLAAAWSEAGRLFLRYEPAPGATVSCDQIVILDAADGALLGRIVSAPGP